MTHTFCGSLQILWQHDRMEFHLCTYHEQRFSHRRHLVSSFHVYDENHSPVTTRFKKVSRLWLDFFHVLLDLLETTGILHHSISRFGRNLRSDNESHCT